MSIERVDKYTLLVDGHHVTAGKETERIIRALTEEQRERFLTILGKDVRKP